tara:strand:- start:824 stop:991 length:168 start_codon:yes stop_codon:yes gene_type:complete
VNRALRKYRSIQARKRRALVRKIREKLLKRFYANKRHLREKYKKIKRRQQSQIEE